jgi:hypothetical protein
MPRDELIGAMARALSTKAYGVDIYDKHGEEVKAIWLAWAAAALSAIEAAGFAVVPKVATTAAVPPVNNRHVIMNQSGSVNDPQTTPARVDGDS